MFRNPNTTHRKQNRKIKKPL